MTTSKIIHIVAGPTAGGKSSFALKLAAKENGIIINCDSIQIYDDLPLLTAQPTKEEQASAPHLLYGCRHPDNVCSAGEWRNLVMPLIDDATANGQTPIICGGTGLYIKALTDGLSPMPDIPEEIRASTVALQSELGNPAFHAALAKRDPVMAERLHPYHTARLTRAWEVLEATGKSLAEWQAMPREKPPAHWDFRIHKILPDRKLLRERCDKRFDHMMENGAIEECLRFRERMESGDVAEDAPLTKALGFKQICDYLDGIISYEDAIEKAKTLTKQYAKRQTTWFRNQA